MRLVKTADDQQIDPNQLDFRSVITGLLVIDYTASQVTVNISQMYWIPFRTILFQNLGILDRCVRVGETHALKLERSTLSTFYITMEILADWMTSTPSSPLATQLHGPSWS